jgi:hypothetical protein
MRVIAAIIVGDRDHVTCCTLGEPLIKEPGVGHLRMACQIFHFHLTSSLYSELHQSGEVRAVFAKIEPMPEQCH